MTSVWDDGGAPFPPVTGREPCKRVATEVFFSGPARAAKWVCTQQALPCPVREQCLAYALTHAVTGVWGGTDEAERRRWRRRNKVTPVPVTPVELDHQMVIRAHQRGMPNAKIAELAAVRVSAVEACLATWRRDQRVAQ